MLRLVSDKPNNYLLHLLAWCWCWILVLIFTYRPPSTPLPLSRSLSLLAKLQPGKRIKQTKRKRHKCVIYDPKSFRLHRILTCYTTLKLFLCPFFSLLLSSPWVHISCNHDFVCVCVCLAHIITFSAASRFSFVVAPIHFFLFLFAPFFLYPSSNFETKKLKTNRSRAGIYYCAKNHMI